MHEVLNANAEPSERPSQASNPLPIETVRDLLGIVRVLYALARRKGNHGHARDLQSAGKQLRRALELVIRNGDTRAQAHAWQLANAAIMTIARLQGSAKIALGEVVELATLRVKKRRFNASDRQSRREARIKRG